VKPLPLPLLLLLLLLLPLPLPLLLQRTRRSDLRRVLLAVGKGAPYFTGLTGSG
jgi:hypothetical protein